MITWSTEHWYYLIASDHCNPCSIPNNMWDGHVDNILYTILGTNNFDSYLGIWCWLLYCCFSICL